ncbi:hypothetical protein PanWU01x14_043050 [Parasponia andersonii]|uniref:Uncharacterized protein n=1 Tax=Parasponia andersonii TaxID=3476 RepID=A0A2P5DPX7_PARAD|nr:hypothetical protein PanWU01x14_043050 [Parasponia andersonii]
MVASKRPVVRTVIKGVANSPGVLLKLIIERFVRTRTSTQMGFAKLGIPEENLPSLEVALLLLLEVINFPLEMLAINASLRGGTRRSSVPAPSPEFLLNSTKLVIPAGEASTSEMRSSRNSTWFAFSGIGYPKAEQNRGRFPGEPL